MIMVAASLPLVYCANRKLACNFMMTCAADITDKDTLGRAAFANLCKYFTEA